MSSDKFNPALTNSMSEHQLYTGGAEVVNLTPVFISTSNTDDWTALAEKAFFYDENGAGRKLDGNRVYFSSESYVNQQITAAIEGLEREFFFDPNTDSAPTRPDGTVKARDTFVVKADGTWDGQSLRKGDTFKATVDIAAGTTPSFSDYYYNEAVSGLEEVPDATTSIKGLVQLVDNIATDGTASGSLVATEAAIAAALSALQSAINASITAGDTALQGQIDTLSGSVSTNTSNIADNASDIADLTSDMEERVRYSSASEQAIDSNLKIGGSQESQVASHFNNSGLTQSENQINTSGDYSHVSVGDTMTYKNGNTVIGALEVSQVIFYAGKNTTDFVFTSSFSIADQATYDFYHSSTEERDLTVTGDAYVKTGKMTETEDKLFMVQSEKDALTAAGTAISTLNTEMDAVEAANTAQNSRLTAIEAYTQQSVTLTVGNGTDTEVRLATGKTWKDANAVTFVTLVSDGGVYKRSNVLNTKYVDPATNEFVMRFANPPAAGAYQVIVSGLAATA